MKHIYYSIFWCFAGAKRSYLSYTLAITFRNPYKFKHNTETFITNEGMYTSQFLYAGKNAALTIGNVLHARHPPSLVPPLQGQKMSPTSTSYLRWP
ncbi:unnamed protein product [Alternaria alternata]